MKALYFMFVIALFSGWDLSARSADAQTNLPAETEQSVNDTVDANNTDSDNTQNSAIDITDVEQEVADSDAGSPANNEPFIPSIQISEDLSVSFPVDI